MKEDVERNAGCAYMLGVRPAAVTVEVITCLVMMEWYFKHVPIIIFIRVSI